MSQYDYIIVGSGFTGAVFAQQATAAGKRVLVLERHNHIGGNCYSFDYEDTLINVHKYGTHIFHTNDQDIWNYITQFSEFTSYQHRVLTTYHSRVYSMPINLGTINAFYNVNLRPSEVALFLESKRGRIDHPVNLEEKAISLIGADLYEAFIKGYTIKQWGCDPKNLPASIITRLPVRDSYHDAYFDDRYQGMPVRGYTPVFERMMDGVDVELGVDFFDDREMWMRRGAKVLYTGPIDRFFDYQHGHLNWRSVRFETEVVPVCDYQGTSVMNFADEVVPYTRIHEPKHLHRERKSDPSRTVIVREYSHIDNDEPYYPVNFKEDRDILEQYQTMQSLFEGKVLFGGRLAQYKYYDMHQVIGQALAMARREFK